MIVLDTHPWLWWLHDPAQLSPEARKRVRQATEKNTALVSAISIWEVALKVKQGKLKLHMELDNWLARARSYRGIRIEPVMPDDAIEGTRLPGEGIRDPADQLIVALTRRYGATLVTRDPLLLKYSHVRTVG